MTGGDLRLLIVVFSSNIVVFMLAVEQLSSISRVRVIPMGVHVGASTSYESQLHFTGAPHGVQTGWARFRGKGSTVWMLRVSKQGKQGRQGRTAHLGRHRR